MHPRQRDSHARYTFTIEGTVEPQPVWDLQDRLKVSQNELARLLGLSTGFMSQLLNGTRYPSPRTQRRIQRFFGDVSPDELFIVVEPDAQGPDPSVRIKREADSIADGTQVSLAAILPPGSTEMPKDFPKRLVASLMATSLPWIQFAYVVGGQSKADGPLEKRRREVWRRGDALPVPARSAHSQRTADAPWRRSPGWTHSASPEGWEVGGWSDPGQHTFE